jgi:dTDP-4-dehydrorhamnose 3,5-epimerase
VGYRVVKIRELGISGAWEVEPVLHGDRRGLFLEWYRHDLLQAETGHPLRLAQANLSVSARGSVRGIHYADVPPGQAKYITCTRGAMVDVVVDIRVGSPTYGRWEAVRLDDVERRALYLSEGLGHAVCALTDDATLLYLVSEHYNPAAEHTIHPLDPEIGVEWPVDGEPILSARDAAAPTLAEAAAAGTLPQFTACRNHIATLRARKDS